MRADLVSNRSEFKEFEDLKALEASGFASTQLKEFAFGLYLKVNRSWMYKYAYRNPEKVSYSRSVVKSVHEDSAVIVLTMYDQDKKVWREMEEGKEMTIQFTPLELASDFKEQVSEGGLIEGAGRKWFTVKRTVEQGDRKFTAWESVEYPNLLIRKESEDMTMTLEEFSE